MYPRSGGYIREGDKGRAHLFQHRNLYLLPWLNVEALTKDTASLISLMDGRTARDPCAFAAFDYQQIDYGFRQDMLALEYNPHCVTFYGDRFGSMVHWNASAFHRGDMVSFPRALLALDAQHTLSKFLFDTIGLLCTQANGEWKPSGRLQLDDFVRKGSLATQRLIVQTTFSGTPSSAPPAFDIRGIVEALKGRLRVAVDELWLLQTDIFVAHNHLALLKGSVIVDAPPDGRSGSVDISLVQRMMLAVEMVEHWQYLLQEAEVAQKMIDAEQRFAKQGIALSRNYADALALFDWVLNQHLKSTSSKIGQLMLTSSKFNQNLFWKQVCCARHFRLPKIQVQGCSVSALTNQQGNEYIVWQPELASSMKDPISNNLNALHKYEEDFSLPRSYHLEQLEEHLEQTSNMESACIDDLLWNLVADTSLVNDVLSAVKLHRPGSHFPDGMITPMGKLQHSSRVY